jgi:hypothetical protein
MKSSFHAAGSFLLLVLTAAVNAPARAVTGDEIKGFGVCQAWASAVYKSPDSFPEDWKAWALGLQATGVASPMNDQWSPFRDNPAFQEALAAARKSLAKESPSAESPNHKQAYAACMKHAELLQQNGKHNDLPGFCCLRRLA